MTQPPDPQSEVCPRCKGQAPIRGINCDRCKGTGKVPAAIRDEIERWMIYVCPDCGDNCQLTSGSEHGFFGTCNACEVGHRELDPIEVIPAETAQARIAELEGELDQQQGFKHQAYQRVYEERTRAESAEAQLAKMREALNYIHAHSIFASHEPRKTLARQLRIIETACCSLLSQSGSSTSGSSDE